MIKDEEFKELFECQINLENWNRIVEQTRRDIKELLKDYNKQKKRDIKELVKDYNKSNKLPKYRKNGVTAYIYNLDGTLISENAPTRVIRKLTQCSYCKIYYNFGIKSFYYDCGYIISKQQLTPSELKKIALNPQKWK